MPVWLIRCANNKGMTLLELLVTLAVSSLLLTAVFIFLVPTLRLFAKTRDAAQAKELANLAMDLIENSVYSTDALTLRASTSSPASGLDADPRDCFLLTCDPGQESGAPRVYSEKNDSVSYPLGGIFTGFALDAEFARARIAAAEARVLSVTLRVSKNGGGSEIIYTLQKDIYLANLALSGEGIAAQPAAGAPYRELLYYRPDGYQPLPP